MAALCPSLVSQANLRCFRRAVGIDTSAPGMSSGGGGGGSCGGSGGGDTMSHDGDDGQGSGNVTQGTAAGGGRGGTVPPPPEELVSELASVAVTACIAAGQAAAEAHAAAAAAAGAAGSHAGGRDAAAHAAHAAAGAAEAALSSALRILGPAEGALSLQQHHSGAVYGSGTPATAGGRPGQDPTKAVWTEPQLLAAAVQLRRLARHLATAGAAIAAAASGSDEAHVAAVGEQYLDRLLVEGGGTALQDALAEVNAAFETNWHMPYSWRFRAQLAALVVELIPLQVERFALGKEYVNFRASLSLQRSMLGKQTKRIPGLWGHPRGACTLPLRR